MNKYALMAIEAGSNNAILILWHYYQKRLDLITNFYLDMQNIKNEKMQKLLEPIITTYFVYLNDKC